MRPALCAAGPVDGPAIFTNCSGGQVAVACQQFQAKNCTDVEFGASTVALLRRMSYRKLMSRRVGQRGISDRSSWLMIQDGLAFPTSASIDSSHMASHDRLQSLAMLIVMSVVQRCTARRTPASAGPMGCDSRPGPAPTRSSRSTSGLRASTRRTINGTRCGAPLMCFSRCPFARRCERYLWEPAIVHHPAARRVAHINTVPAMSAGCVVPSQRHATQLLMCRAAGHRFGRVCRALLHLTGGLQMFMVPAAMPLKCSSL